MPQSDTKSTNSANTGASLDSLSAAIVAAIEEGFGAVVGHAATTGSALSDSIAGGSSGGMVPLALGLEEGSAQKEGAASKFTSPSIEASGEGLMAVAAAHEGGSEGGGEKHSSKYLPLPSSLKEGLGRLTESAWEEKIGVAYSGYELLSGLGKRYNELNQGQYVTPEEKAASLTEAVAPGVGGILGAGLGTILGGPAGGLLGSFLGQGAGEVVGSVVDAGDKRDQATRETSERLAASLGLAEESVKSFRDAMVATNAPVAQLGQALGVLQGFSPGVGTAAIAGAGRMANAEGADFVENTKTLGTFFHNNPALYGINTQFATQGGELTKPEFQAAAGFALSQDDMPAYNAAMRGAASADYKDDTEWKRLDAAAKEQEDSWPGKLNHWSHEVDRDVLPHLGISKSWIDATDDDPVADAEKAAEERKKELGKDDSAKAAQDATYSLARGQAKLGIINSDVAANTEIGEYRYEALGSASPEDLAKRLPAIKASLEKEAAADRTLIAQDEASIKSLGPETNDPAINSIRQGYQTEIGKLTDDEIQKKDIAFATLAKENFEEVFKGREAGYGLEELRGQIEGKSAAEIQQVTRRESAYLQGVENDPKSPISPEEKANIEKGRLSLNYQAQLAVGAEKLSEIDLHTTQAQTKVAQAQANSGPQEVYEAQQGVLTTYTARIKELTEELHAGGLAVADRVAREKELASTQAQAAQLEASARETLYAGRHGIAEDTLGAMTDGLSRQIAIGGNQAVTAQMIGESEHSLAIDRDALAQAKTPAEKARISRAITDDTLQQAQLETARQTYSPTAETSIQDVTLAGEETRAARLGGQGAQDAARARAAQDARELADVQTAQSTATDPLARVANTQREQALLTDAADQTTAAQTWSMSVQQQAGDIEATGRFRRSLLEPYQDGGINADPFQRGNELLAEKQGLLKSAQEALAKTDRNDPAFAKNTAAVNSLEDDISGLQHEKLENEYSAEPEAIIGGRGFSRGMAVSVTPTAALNAYYASGYSPLDGNFGSGASHGHTGLLPGSVLASPGRVSEPFGTRSRSLTPAEAAHPHDGAYPLPSVFADDPARPHANPARPAPGVSPTSAPHGPDAARTGATDGPAALLQAVREQTAVLRQVQQLLSRSTSSVHSPQGAVHANELYQATTGRR